MTRQTKIQQIKYFIKASIVLSVLFVFVVLGIFIHPSRTFENSHMKKWLSLNEQPRTQTILRVVKDTKNRDLLIKCVDKIASLPNSNEMQIQYAIVFCDKAILQNEE